MRVSLTKAKIVQARVGFRGIEIGGKDATALHDALHRIFDFDIIDLFTSVSVVVHVSI